MKIGYKDEEHSASTPKRWQLFVQALRFRTEQHFRYDRLLTEIGNPGLHRSRVLQLQEAHQR